MTLRDFDVTPACRNGPRGIVKVDITMTPKGRDTGRARNVGIEIIRAGVTSAANGIADSI